MVVQVLVFLVFLVFSMFFSVTPESLLVVSVAVSISVWKKGEGQPKCNGVSGFVFF